MMDSVNFLQVSSADRQQMNKTGAVATHKAHGSPPPSWSEVQSVKLSRNSCMMRVESLYESSATLSNSAMASSNAVRAILQASSGFESTSYWKTEKFKARPRRIGCVTAKSFSATFCASEYARRAFSAAWDFFSPSENSAM